MTKREFISFVESSLDFLDSKEKETALAFFSEKFSLCTSEDDENAIIEAFGDPSKFVEKFKADHRSFQKSKKNKEKTIKKYLDSRFRQNAPVLGEKVDQDYLAGQNSEQIDPASNEGTKESPQKRTPKKKKNAKEIKKENEKQNEEENKTENVKADDQDSKVDQEAEINEQKESAEPSKIEAKENFLKSISDAFSSLKNNVILPLLNKFNSKTNQTGTHNEEAGLEPIDEANGLTAEEIDLAKAETLEKANSFYEHEEEILSAVNEEKDFTVGSENEEERNEDTAPIPLEEEEETGKKIKIPKLPEIVYPGLFNQFVPKDKYNDYARIGLLALLTLAVSPALAVAIGLVLFVYAALVAFTLTVAGGFFAIMIVLIACGIVELVHGFLLIFDSVPAALIEIGFGTVLFSIVTAISALVYEFVFGIVPKWLKWITSVFIRYTKLLFCYLYGGKA